MKSKITPLLLLLISTILTLVLVYLKISGYLQLSWWAVFTPFYVAGFWFALIFIISAAMLKDLDDNW